MKSAPQSIASAKADWKPDQECHSCEGCQALFRFYRRRHHCRRCGGVFCSACTSDRVTGLQGYERSGRPQRVCSACKHALAAILEVGQSRPRERRICILGYTGSGKTTLFHQLCSSSGSANFSGGGTNSGGGGGTAARHDLRLSAGESRSPSLSSSRRASQTAADQVPPPPPLRQTTQPPSPFALPAGAPHPGTGGGGDDGILSVAHAAKTQIVRSRGSDYVFHVVDTVGQSGFESFQPQCTIGTHAYVLLFNPLDRQSFAAVSRLRDKVLECVGKERLTVLVGNVFDEQSADQERVVAYSDAQHLADSWNMPYFECSARRKRSIDELLTDVILRGIVEREKREVLL